MEGYYIRRFNFGGLIIILKSYLKYLSYLLEIVVLVIEIGWSCRMDVWFLVIVICLFVNFEWFLFRF